MVKTQQQLVIGIVPSFDEGVIIPAGGGDVKRMYIRHEYGDMLGSVGVLPIILSPAMPLQSIMELCDGIVISGGEDIEPRRYGRDRLPTLRRVEPSARFEWEERLIRASDAAGRPILGICYGMQRLNVHYGGTLIQDIPTEMPDNVGHDTTTHHVTFSDDFLGMRSMGVHAVNSRHHQAIEHLADGFTVCATADDGIIEAVKGHRHFGMQWHPESDETGAHVYRSFAEYCYELRYGPGNVA